MEMASSNRSEGLTGPGALVKKAGGWLVAIAVVFIVLGVMAIAEPAVAGLAVAILVGWLLIFGGVAHAVSALGGGGARRVIWQALVGVVYFVGGAYFLTHPLLGLGTLTLFLAAILLVEAILELVAYFETRGEPGAGARLVNGLVTIFLGGLIWLNWPSSSVWAIGTLVGVNLLMTGITRLTLGLAARKLATRLPA
jgi:uncharacterized membrane protein HdeD (DUF308 family)